MAKTKNKSIKFSAYYSRGGRIYRPCTVEIAIFMGYNVTIHDDETGKCEFVHPYRIGVAYEDGSFIDLKNDNNERIFPALAVGGKMAVKVDNWLTKVSCYNDHVQW